MKKTHLLVGLGISISLLTACQNSSSGSSSATTEAETTVAPKPVTDYTLYNSILKDYKEVVENVTKHANDHSKIKHNDNVNLLAYSLKKTLTLRG